MLKMYTYIFKKSRNGWVNIYFKEKVYSAYYFLLWYLALEKGASKFTRVRRIVLPLQTIHLQRLSHWWKIVKWNFFFFLWWIIYAWEWFHHRALFKSLNWTEENGVKSSSEKVNLWKYCYLFHSIINTYWHLHVRQGKANH